jgi:hypothetical protein
MCGIDLSEYTKFGKVCDIWSAGYEERTGLCEFVKSVVMNMDMCDVANKNGYGIMLPDVSNLHVLVSNVDFPFEKLSASQKRGIDSAVAKKNIVLGYIWLCPKTIGSVGEVNYHFIEYIDSRISGLNIVKYMIASYEADTESVEKYLLPYEISSGAEKYWKRYMYEEYEIKGKVDLNEFLADCDLPPSEIKWENLFNILE